MTSRFVLLLALCLGGCSEDDAAPVCAGRCLQGCCDLNGVCQAGNTLQACGAPGTECIQCDAGQVCHEGSCTAECSKTCRGCCDAQGACMQSNNAACGLSGDSCVRCEDGTSCQAGHCLPGAGTCGPSICRNGCCRGNDCIEPGDGKDACGSGGSACDKCEDNEQCVGGSCQDDPCGKCAAEQKCCYEGKCFPGNTFGLCGKPGGQCVGCDPGQTCFDNECVKSNCDEDLCKEGCCQDNSCHLPGPSDPDACGTGGKKCVPCDPGEICQNGGCMDPPKVCVPDDCDGCCDDDGDCVDGDEDGACGKGGDCAECGSSQECKDFKCTCTPTSCPDGCCDGDVCKDGDKNDACGTKGIECESCTGTESCSEGSCGETCDEIICPNGCCIGSTCHEDGPTDEANCGAGGMPCDPCDTAAGEECQDGVCNNPIACGPSGADPCLGGCCQSNACQVGTAPGACGIGGETCTLCPSWALCQSTATDRFCDASNESKWRVSLSEVVLDSNISWDGSTPPDVFVEVTVGGQTKTSSTVDDQYVAQFDEYLLTATGAELKAKLSYVIYDDDPWPVPNTKILSCDDMVYPDEFAQGYALINFPCGNAIANPVLSIRFTLTLDSP